MRNNSNCTALQMQQFLANASDNVSEQSASSSWSSSSAAAPTVCTLDTLSVPHLTFADHIIFVGVLSTKTVNITLTTLVSEMFAAPAPAVPPSPKTACPSTVKDKPCSGHGRCVTRSAGLGVSNISENGVGHCVCAGRFLGEDCSIEAFSRVASQPHVTITSIESSTNSTTAKGGSVVRALVNNAPRGAVVRAYVDGKPYPSAGIHVWDAKQRVAAANISLRVYGASLSSTHSIQLFLLLRHNSERNVTSFVPLDIAKQKFHLPWIGGCGSNCSSHGVCHRGYCVCHDGYVGEACERKRGQGVVGGGGKGAILYSAHTVNQAQQRAAQTFALSKSQVLSGVAMQDDSMRLARRTANPRML